MNETATSIELDQLTALRDQLKASLSGTAPQPNTESLPRAPELAEQIKALKTAHTIEAAPERIGKRRSSGEEPVTARIRRRMERILAADASSEAEGDRAVGQSLDGESAE